MLVQFTSFSHTTYWIWGYLVQNILKLTFSCWLSNFSLTRSLPTSHEQFCRHWNRSLERKISSILRDPLGSILCNEDFIDLQYCILGCQSKLAAGMSYESNSKANHFQITLMETGLARVLNLSTPR